MKKSLKITREQTELTPEQLECAKQYAKDKIALYLSTEKVDKKLVESYVVNAYKVAGINPPKKIKWFKSPESFVKQEAPVGASVRSSVVDSVRDSVWDSVVASVVASVWDSVRASVRASMWASVLDSVWASVGDSVGAWYSSDSWSFYGFFNEYFEPNKIVWLQKLSESVNGYAFYENECLLVQKPTTLDLVEGKLHSTTRKAIEWADKTGYYFLHGVRFDEKLWKRVTGKRPRIKTILSIENMEQRMAALKTVGVERIIKGATLLDKSTRGNELYLVENVFDEPALYLKYKCPSTGRVYASGVDPSLERKADICMAWKFSMTEDDYAKLEVEA